ncbi:hypothetical protein FQA39_LY16937 [Lamprigera yunnana]|nr:hypothetical protein FQA39_LY16937 [Lamprigera yunnana]
MMGDQFRKVEQYSPKSSPRGARSPVVSRQDSSGTLKTTILLGKNPSIVPSGPFYLMKEPPGDSELTGATNLMAYYGLEHSYTKFSGKKLKEALSSFLPTLPGVIDSPGAQDNSSLRSVIDKPPIVGKELLPLTSSQLDGFRLHPGPNNCFVVYIKLRYKSVVHKMVRSCSAYACTNEWKSNGVNRFHRFPMKRPEILKLWIQAVRLKDFNIGNIG